MDIPKYLEKADSSMVAIRAAAAGIDARHCDPFERSKFERFAGRLLNNLPKHYRKSVLRNLARTMGVTRDHASEVDAEEILRWGVSLILGDDIYSGVVVGAPNGAVAHLASLLRFPFLTQHYLLAFKGRYAPDDSKAYFEDGVAISREVLKNNPDLEAIVHYDPLHDRFLITRVNFIRLKFRSLPEIYRKFIRKRVKPGGVVVSVECSYPWMMYPVKSDHGELYYQVGGLGDVTPGEYLSDSTRLKDYRKQEGGDPESKWGISDIEPVERPESEWGSVGTMADELEEFAKVNGYRHIRVKYPHPENYSMLAFRAYQEAVKLAGERMKSVCFDCFTHIDPRFNLLTHTPAVWLPFICGDSYRFAEKIARELPSELDIWLSLHPSFCDPVDLTGLEKWKGLFSRFKSLNLLGINEKKYPADLTTYVDYALATCHATEKNKKDYALAIDADLLQSLVGRNQI